MRLRTMTLRSSSFSPLTIPLSARAKPHVPFLSSCYTLLYNETTVETLHDSHLI
jgi:hypothetical protein